ncbi:selenocysteine-specific translation elongation factor [Fodinicola feengrottensis]|uniref:Selenocysteine-specific elongation factor n=1 Tax=Fodinicola feengrottensis TaxID=435914 RepID=A0ABN2GNJ5_9ACTN
MHVIATAGHVDHGKSTLVRALTGMEPDRWEEEHRRGLTIGLGFGWTTLANGEQVAFVDVPGHEKFVPTMLAGVGSVPAALLVVAADAGWMPQSSEHLSALDALGVRHGLLVISRADLADPEPARRQSLDIVARSGLGALSTVVVSAVTGQGLDQLRAEISQLVKALPAPDRQADVRLWVDRRFTLRGTGTVVTGTLAAGTVRVGDTLSIAATGQVGKVRGLHALGEPRDEVTATARVAVNLRGVDRADVRTGDALVAPDRWLTATSLDVAVPEADRLPGRLVLHLGSAAVPVQLRPLGKLAARLTLERPLPVRYGDRVLLRDPGRHQIAAGATVLAVDPAQFRRRGAAASRAADLTVLAAMSSGRPAAASELTLRQHGFRLAAELTRAGLPLAGEPISHWRADPARLAELVRRAPTEVSAWQAENPLSAGIAVDTLRQRLDVPDREILTELLRRAGLRVAEGVVRQEAETTLPPRVAEAVRAVRDALAASPFSAPDAPRLAELGLGNAELAAASRAGYLLRLPAGVVLLPDAPHIAARVLGGLPQPFGLSEARQALGTTRRVALPLLEFLDRLRITERLPDDRRRLREVDLDDSTIHA